MIRKLMATLIGAAMPLAALAQDVVAEKATGPWNVEFAESNCIAERPFGEARLLFRMVPMSYDSEVVLAVPASSPFGRPTGRSNGLLRFTEQGEAIRVPYVHTTTGDGQWRMLLFRITNPERAQLVASQRIEATAGDTTIALAASGMTALMKTMDRCLDDLLTAWKIDTSQSADVAVPPIPAGKLRTWVEADDYPAEAVRSGKGGTVVVRFDIDVTGRVTECATVVTSGTPVLDEAACKAILTRARFHPAVGKDGKPRPYSSLQRVAWTIPPR